MQRLVDNVIAISKESVKTFTYESLNNIVRLINGFSAMLLAILPGKASILEGMSGWELRPTFRGPRLPRWMENGVSSFNQFIHEASIDSDTSSSAEYLSDGEDNFSPGTPLSQSCRTPFSQSSRFSRERSFSNRNRSWMQWIMCILSWLLFPVKFLLGAPRYIFRLASRKPSKAPIKLRTPRSSVDSPRTLQSLRDSVFQRATNRATDRRRGVIEDLHLATEICIESVFDVVHKAAHCLLSPLDTMRRTLEWFTTRNIEHEDIPDEGIETSIPTALLSQEDPTPLEKVEKITSYNALNTDARTCRDVITEYGYPYEAIRVVTTDGYVLLLERIPRRDSRKVVFLQHGILDSSMGWVSNGVVGSPAFAAFDQGFDVFLGNFRGLISREHVDPKISSRQYWNYSINEHGTKDIPAMLEKIHQVKTSELKSINSDPQEEINPDQPYKVCAICHSLGGAAILMYILTRRVERKPHRLSRTILLSPAGFHHDSTVLFSTVEYLFLLFAPVLGRIFPAFYIPTRFFRMLLNKLARDFHNLPAVGGLVQTLMSYVVGGDSSNWVGVLGLPHYNMNDMPGVAFRVALHLAQMKHGKKFRMFDYGSPGANMEIYGSPEPLDLGECYGMIDIPIDLVAGKKDRVIRPSMVRKHYQLMKDGGVNASFREFEYAHLDFTFSHREELLSYVMYRLLLVDPSAKRLSGPKALKLKKKELRVDTGE